MSQQGHQYLSSPQTSYVATNDNRIPKYIIKIEIMEAVDAPNNEVDIKGRAKTQYLVYDCWDDDVYYKTQQLLAHISKRLGERNERQAGTLNH